MEIYLKKYLSHINMSLEYKYSDINCEICDFSEKTIIREDINIGKGVVGKLPVVSCNNCGYLYQNHRFEERFYDDFYSKSYRKLIYNNTEPEENFINDQIKRGEKVYNFVKPFFKNAGKVLDVGSSIGGMLIPFLKNGWTGLGTDPDSGYVEYGKNKLNLPVIDVKAENMVLKKNFFDLIIIMGSLEHVYDPNKTLAICRESAKENSLLLLEGRGHPQSHSSTYFNHNHHRYFTLNSIELMMIKFGWEPIITTDEQICGPSRAGGIYCLGRLKKTPNQKQFHELIKNGKYENCEDLIKKFNKIDLKFGRK